MKHDLTQGNILRSIILFTLPLLIGNLMQQAYNLVDTYVVGMALGSNALASVGSCYTLMTFLISILTGLCMEVLLWFLFILERKTGMFYIRE